MVEVIHAGGIHESLVEVGAGINASWDHQLAGGIYDLGPTWDHELSAHLLDDAVFNVDICLLGAVIIDDLPPLDEDPHHGSIGKHGSRKGHSRFHVREVLDCRTLKTQLTMQALSTREAHKAQAHKREVLQARPNSEKDCWEP